MSYLSAVFLGIVHGAADFFPISSSGHLSIFQHFLGVSSMTDEHLFFLFLLRLGALAAAVFACRSELRLILFSASRPSERKGKVNQKVVFGKRLGLLLLVGTAPLLVILPFRTAIKSLFDSTFFVGCAMILTGFLLFFFSRYTHGDKTEKNASLTDALLIGLSQAVSFFPGLSRTACSVTVGQGRGFSRKAAFSFSVLLSVPALLCSDFMTLVDVFSVGISFSMLPRYLLGMIASGVSAYFAIHLMRRLSERIGFAGFTYYCWTTGCVSLILSLIR